MRLRNSTPEPDKDWSVRREGHFTNDFEDFSFYGKYTCKKYLTYFQWYEVSHAIKGPTVLYRCYGTAREEAARTKVRSLKKALAWADTFIEEGDKLSVRRYNPFAWIFKAHSKAEKVAHVYRVVSGVIGPMASVFSDLFGEPSNIIYGSHGVLGNHVSNGWPSGTYYIVHSSGRVSVVTLTGTGMSSGGAYSKEERDIASHLFRWTHHGIAPFRKTNRFSWGATVVHKGTSEVHQVMGVPVTENLKKYELSGTCTFVDEDCLVLPEEWVKQSLAQ